MRKENAEKRQLSGDRCGISCRFVTASLVMYEKVREAVKGSIRDEAEYVRTLMEAAQGDREPVGTFIWCPPWARRRPTGLRSWIPAGKVLYDSEEDPADHGKSCEPA